MTDEFENFNDRDEAWLNELELRAAELETELFDWREAHARELAETSHGQNGAPHRTRDGRPGMLRAQPRPTQRRATPPRPAEPLDDEPEDEFYRGIEDEDEDDLTTVIRTGGRPAWPDQGRRRPSAEQRTQALVDRGRRSAARARTPKSRKGLFIGTSVAAVIAIASFFI